MLEPASQTASSDHYLQLKHEFIEFLFASVRDLRGVFDGDLDAMLIFVALSRLHLRNERVSLITGIDYCESEYSWSCTRIAEATDIPRETVRRKLKTLEEKRLIERDADSRWRIRSDNEASMVRPENEQVWQQEIRRLVRLVSSINESKISAW